MISIIFCLRNHRKKSQRSERKSQESTEAKERTLKVVEKKFEDIEKNGFKETNSIAHCVYHYSESIKHN